MPLTLRELGQTTATRVEGQREPTRTASAAVSPALRRAAPRASTAPSASAPERPTPLLDGPPPLPGHHAPPLSREHAAMLDDFLERTNDGDAASFAVAFGATKVVDNPNAAISIASTGSQLASATGNLLNKVAGPQREADKKKVEQKNHQMMQEIFEQGVENATQNYDEARELMKLAVKILNEHAERQTQITTTITRV